MSVLRDPGGVPPEYGECKLLFLGLFVKFCCSLYLGLFGFGFVYKSVVSFSELWVRVYMFFVFTVILCKGVIFTGLHGLKFVIFSYD